VSPCLGFRPSVEFFECLILFWLEAAGPPPTVANLRLPPVNDHAANPAEANKGARLAAQDAQEQGSYASEPGVEGSSPAPR
jgi:hypothetical protein